MSNLADQIKNLSPAKRALLEEKLAARAASTNPTLPRRQAGDPRVLSCAQHQLWFLDQLAPGTSAYNVPYAVRLYGQLDAEALRKSLDAIVGRHQVLRTMFVPYQGKVIPAVAKQWSVEFREVDLRIASIDDGASHVQHLIQEDAARPFDLARELKLRSTLYRLTDETSIWLHAAHHIAWDLHSRVVFYQELEQLYRGFRAGTEVTLPDLPVQYADYALWQHRHLQGETLARLEAYWKQQLAGAPSTLNLPTDHSRPAFQDLRGAKFPVRLSSTVLEAGRALARDNKVTLYMTLLAVFYVFLHCYSGQEDICVGSPFDDRNHEQTDPLIGMFINTLVLRTRLDGGPTFLQLILRVRDTVLGALAHKTLPFEKIVDVVQPPRDLGRMPLFQANFRLQSDAARPLKLVDLDAELLSVIDNASAKFDVALELPALPETSGFLEYSTSLFKPTTAQRMADDFQALLCGLFAQPDIPIDHIDIVRTIKARI